MTSACTGCGICTENVKLRCPQFEMEMMNQSYLHPFPQAIPNKPVIDRKNCRYFKTGKCGSVKIMSAQAVNFTQEDQLVLSVMVLL